MKLLQTILLLATSALAFADDREELTRLVETYTSTVATLDMEKIQPIWSTSDTTSFIHPRGHQVGWENIRQFFYMETMGRLAKRELTYHNLNIRLIDANSALGDFYWDFEATMKDGTEITSAGRETQIWQKIDGMWKIVHVHYSGMPVTGEREGF